MTDFRCMFLSLQHPDPVSFVLFYPSRWSTPAHRDSVRGNREEGRKGATSLSLLVQTSSPAVSDVPDVDPGQERSFERHYDKPFQELTEYGYVHFPGIGHKPHGSL